MTDPLDTGHLALDAYRNAAEYVFPGQHYRGLNIHGYPAIHDRVAQIAKTSLPDGAHILDLAAGTGALCLRLKDLGFNLTAADLVAENFKLHGVVNYLTINLNLPLPDMLSEQFDCVVATEIMEHLENPRLFLRQCYRVLRKDGFLIISTPNVDSPFSRASYMRTGRFRWFYDGNYTQDGHITPLPLFVLRDAIREAGFCDCTVESVADIHINSWRTWMLGRVVKLLAKDHPPEGDVIVLTSRKRSEYVK